MFLKGLTKTLNALGRSAEAMADLVEESVSLGKDKIVNMRELGDTEHAVELIQVSKKVDSEDIVDAMAKLQAMKDARLNKPEEESKDGE